MEFTYNLAGPEDDPALRQLMSRNPVPGHITLRYEREPNYFLGCGPMGHFWQVIVSRHRPTGQIAGLACRAVRPLFINGQAEAVGYLSQLRIDGPFRGRWIVSGGFRYIQQLHADGRVAGYISTIIEGSDEAVGILVRRPRPHFPPFREMARLWVLSLIVGRPRSLPDSLCEIRRGSTTELERIVAFLRRHGPAKQFFPAYTAADFGPDSSLTLGFAVEDFVLAWQGDRLVGVAGLWDQSAYKQTVVHAYRGRLAYLRPVYNIGLRLMGAQPLPAPGQKIRFAYASFICVAQNEPAIFGLLLQALYNLAAERGYAYLTVGLAEADPLLAVARRHRHIAYYSRLYSVGWDEAWHNRLDGRLPYIEVASL